MKQKRRMVEVISFTRHCGLCGAKLGVSDARALKLSLAPNEQSFAHPPGDCRHAGRVIGPMAIRSRRHTHWEVMAR